VTDRAPAGGGSAAGDTPPTFGLLAEFGTAERVLEAARRARADGYRLMDAFTPFPVEGLAEAVGFRREVLPWVALAGGVLGGIGGFGMLFFACVYSYPLNVGGRPLNSWPAFIPITFELTILGAALAAVAGMLLLNWLPRPYHPVFNVPRFTAASRDRFFVVIRAGDPRFDLERTRRFLLEVLGADGVFEVER
jgi:hypothetical protein